MFIPSPKFGPVFISRVIVACTVPSPPRLPLASFALCACVVLNTFGTPGSPRTPLHQSWFVPVSTLNISTRPDPGRNPVFFKQTSRQPREPNVNRKCPIIIVKQCLANVCQCASPQRLPPSSVRSFGGFPLRLFFLFSGLGVGFSDRLLPSLV